MASKENQSAMENDPGGTSAALSTDAKSSNTDTSVIPKTENSAPQSDENDKFFKKPIRFPADRDFRTTPQYNDQESHMNQRHHSIGLGLFNTDEIDDLPPRHREKVRSVYKKIVDFANNVLPPHVVTTSHGGPIQVSDLLNLKIPEAAKNEPEPCSKVSDCKSYNRNSTTSGASHSELHRPLKDDGRFAESNRTEQKGGSKSPGKFISNKAKELGQSNVEKYTNSKFCKDGSALSEQLQKSSPSHSKRDAVPGHTYSNINFERATSSNGLSNSKSNKNVTSELHVQEGVESRRQDEGGHLNSKSVQNKGSSYPQKQEEKKHKNSDRSPYKSKPPDPKYNRPVPQNLCKSDNSEFSKDGSASSVKDFQSRGSHVPKKHITSENNRICRDDNFASSSNTKGRTFSSASSDNFSLKSDDSRDKRLSGKESKNSLEDETLHRNDSSISKGSSFRKNKYSVDDLSNAYSKDGKGESASSVKGFQNRGSNVPKKIAASENNRINRDVNFANSSNAKGRTFSSASSDNFSLKSDDSRNKRLSGKESKNSIEDETFNRNDSSISKGSTFRKNRHLIDDLSNAYSKEGKEGSASSVKGFQNRGSNVPRKHAVSDNRINTDDNFTNSSDAKGRTFSSASSDNFSLKSDDSRNKRLSGKESKNSIEDETFNRNDSSISKGSKFRKNRHLIDDLSNAYSKEGKEGSASSVKGFQNRGSNVPRKHAASDNRINTDDNFTNSSDAKGRTFSSASSDNFSLKSDDLRGKRLPFIESKNAFEDETFNENNSNFSKGSSFRKNRHSVNDLRNASRELKQWDNPHQEATSTKKYNRNSDSFSYMSESSVTKHGNRQSSILHKGDDSDYSEEDESTTSVNDFRSRGSHLQRKYVPSENHNRTGKDESFGISSKGRDRTLSSVSSDYSTLKSEDFHVDSKSCGRKFQDSRKHSANETYNKKPSRISQGSSFRTKRHSLENSRNASDLIDMQKNSIKDESGLNSRHMSSMVRKTIDDTDRQKHVLDSSDLSVMQHVVNAAYSDLKEIKEQRLDPAREIKKWEDHGFFINVNVSENSSAIEFWEKFFQDLLEHNAFSLDYCCTFTESLILNFQSKEDAYKAAIQLRKSKKKTKDIRKPHITSVANVKTRIVRPCKCEKNMVTDCNRYFDEFSFKYSKEHREKIIEIEDELSSLRHSKSNFSHEHQSNLKNALSTLKVMEAVFDKHSKSLMQEALKSSNVLEIRKLKKNFSRECNSFQRCLPIYSKKDKILEMVRFHPVSVVIADTGSGKSTQLAEYLLSPRMEESGIIICTQPRKIAAITITNYVCGQIGCAVGKLVGYDVGIEKKYDADTKIIYMTDYALLKKCLRNRRLRGVSCVIIDEAHERTLYTDLLLGLLKECVEAVPGLRVVITSATIDPAVFVDFFNLSPQNAIVRVPGRTYPVEEIWLENTVEIGWHYVEKCVKTALKIHLEEAKGDILVFLTSPTEIDESILLFKELCPEFNTPLLLSLHGKTDLQEQKLIFQTTTSTDRKVIFATNAAETSLTIPGIRYVIDSGMAKELVYFPEKNKSCLMVTFINKSSAEQRKGRAGRTQPGVCYRLYSKENFKNMPDRSRPEILKTNLQRALMKICEFGIKPEKFDFVEAPPTETIARSLDSLEQLDLIKNSELTELGKKVVKLPVDPRLSKLVLLGVKAKIGYEVAIIAALVSEAGRLFLRFKDIQVEADKKKLQFCQKSGDLCTFLDVYKKWMEIGKSERYDWCVSNYINSRALNSAAKTVQEILVCLHQELSVRVIRRYNNAAFKSNFENIVFDCFSENLCTYSGHPKLGYSSPYLKEMLFMHPSSSLHYLGKDLPEFLVYGTLMQTSRNFLMDVTPIKKETLDKAYQKGTFKLQVDMMKSLQISPKILGPFGESVLVRHILGKAGSKILNLELTVEKLTKSRNFKIDVSVDKGIIVIYLEKRFHDRVSNFIHNIVDEVHSSMAKEEDIVKMSSGFSYFCLGAGGKISDIIMPGEFKEVIVDSLRKPLLKKVETSIRNFGDLQSFRVTELNQAFCRINATYLRVLDAKSAMRELSRERAFTVKSNVYVEENGEKSLPLYRIQVSWCRSPSTGSGWVEFFSDSDCIIASGRLTRVPLYIENNCIRFTPSDLSTKEIEMSNLPAIVNEEMIREKIIEALEDYAKVKNIYIRRRKVPPVTEKDLAEVKKQLNQAFSCFTPASKLVVEVTYPNARSNVWAAMAYFECRKDGERAVRELEGKLRITSFPAEVKPVIESHLVCKKHVFKSVEEEVARLRKSKKGTRISAELMADSTMMKIQFSCIRIEDLSVLRLQLIRLLQGVKIECFGKKEHSYLFTVSGERFIETIQRRTGTLISLDNLRKTISIYGPKENCSDAELLIRSNVNNQKQYTESKRVFDLKNSCIPSGFLKSLYAKYGLDLLGLVKEFDLEDVKIDMIKGSLALYGSKAQLKQVEDCLEKICSDLHDESKPSKSNSEKDACAICLDPVPYDYYRLENCGHAFCKSCLLLQVQTKTVPVVCVQENCGKDFFLMDIKRIFALGGDSVKQNFYNAALQYHVNSNIGKISNCPSPDCDMVYRVSSSEAVFHCPGCDVDICTLCQTPQHYGMSCEMFQNCVKDEDYSLKIWMQENESLRKQCPKCKVVIEKESGCNHMECFNCKCHFCWLCLEDFPIGDMVYDHLPYCPKNQ